MNFQERLATHVILVRHAKPVIDPAAPAQNWMLDPSTTEDVSDMAANLRAYRPDGALSSPEPKAMETARILAEALEIPLFEREGLEEQGSGQVPWVAGEQAFKAEVARHFAYPEHVILGAESSSDAVDRFGTVVEWARQEFRAPIIVTHGRIMCGYMARVLGIEALSVWSTLLLPDAVLVDMEAMRWHRIDKEIVT